MWDLGRRRCRSDVYNLYIIAICKQYRGVAKITDMIEAIEVRRIDRFSELFIENISRELCSKKFLVIMIRVMEQEQLDKVVKSLMRKGISIFAADNIDNIVRLYITKRSKAECR
ncbi:MAG: hypothetical protein QXE01_07455 [Sulfolobales archaeon]